MTARWLLDECWKDLLIRIIDRPITLNLIRCCRDKRVREHGYRKERSSLLFFRLYIRAGILQFKSDVFLVSGVIVRRVCSKESLANERDRSERERTRFDGE